LPRSALPTFEFWQAILDVQERTSFDVHASTKTDGGQQPLSAIFPEGSFAALEHLADFVEGEQFVGRGLRERGFAESIAHTVGDESAKFVVGHRKQGQAFVGHGFSR
jgi:hypothetical protein